MAYYQPSKGNTIRANRGSHYNPFFEKMIDSLATDSFDKDTKKQINKNKDSENKYQKLSNKNTEQNNYLKRDSKPTKQKKIVI